MALNLRKYSIRLTLLLLVAFFPFLAVDLYRNVRITQSALSIVQNEAELLASSLLLQHNTMIQTSERELFLLSKCPEVRSRDLSTVSATFRTFVRHSNFYVNVALADLDGKVVATALPKMKKVPKTARGAFEEAIRTKRFSVGSGSVSSGHGKPIIPCAQPVLDANGNVTAVVMGGVNLSWFNETISHNVISKEFLLYVVDAGGTVIGMLPKQTEKLGSSFSSLNSIPLAASGKWGSFNDPTHLFLYSPYTDGIRVIIGFNRLEVQEQAFHAFLWSVALLIAIVIAALLLSRIVARKLILKEVEILVRSSIQHAKLASVNELLSNISHQWRQPLTTLSLRVIELQDQLAENEQLPIEEQQELLKGMQNTIQRMSQTITRFCDFFRSDSKKQSFGIKEALVEALELLEGELRDRSIEVHLQVDESLPALTSYYREFVQVLFIILNNCADALEKNAQENRHVYITAEHSGRRILLCFRDNGPGVEDATLDQIFEPYVTTKFKAVGIGISLFQAKVIIEQHMEGKIAAENLADGFAVTLELPVP